MLPFASLTAAAGCARLAQKTQRLIGSRLWVLGRCVVCYGGAGEHCRAVGGGAATRSHTRIRNWGQLGVCVVSMPGCTGSERRRGGDDGGVFETAVVCARRDL